MATTSNENMFPSSTSPVPGTNGSSHASTAVGSATGDMLSRVVERAHATIDRLAESAAPHVHRLSESASSAGELLHNRADQARELGDEWTQSLRSTVREHPLAALATALALGVIIAKLSR